MSDLHSYLEDGNTLQDYSVQRDSTIHIQLLGTYDDNGFRTDGPGYQPAELDDRTYQIKNAGNLYWFAEFLAAGGKGAEINAELTADITIPAGWTWTPIGLEEDGGSNAYTGTFDGQGHTIRGLATAGQEGGLFWAVSANGTVKNLGLTEGSFTGGAGDCVGAIAGRSSGTIENCYSTCTVTGAGTAGGICGSVAADTVRISGCYNTGTLSAPDAAHGIACCTGDVRYDTVVQAGSCFYLAEQEDGTGGKTAAQFASGLVAWLLQNRQSAPVWGQTVGTDASPVLTTDASRKVIRITVQDMTKGPGATELLWANAGRPVGWEEGGYTTAIPTGTDAGTYTVWYRVVGDDTHRDSLPVCVQVVIRQKSASSQQAENSSNSTPTATPAPTAAPTASPTPVPVTRPAAGAASSKSAASRKGTASPVPTATPEPTASPAPTEAPAASELPSPQPQQAETAETPQNRALPWPVLGVGTLAVAAAGGLGGWAFRKRRKN